MPQLKGSLRTEYNNLFNTCNINTSRADAVEKIIGKILINKERYIKTAGSNGIPWYFIAVVHNMESGCSFNCHFHNGDPLTARTKQYPPGRPVKGYPPFTWEESVEDAIYLKNLAQWKDWSVPGLLYKLEQYNGWGYRSSHPHVLSPYLWSYSTHYTRGKYIKDGIWSETAVSDQCGAAVILRRMAERGDVTLGSGDGRKYSAEIHVQTEPLIKYSKRKNEYAKELQAFLNKMPGIFLKEDGIAGDKTSAAVKKVLGFNLAK